MDYEVPKLIIEGVVICVVYIVTMILLILSRKELWIQEYPDAVREKFLENGQSIIEDADVKKRKIKYFWRLLIKKAIALVIYIIVMLVIMQTVEYKEIFLTESFLCSLIIWPAITLLEALLLDIVVIGHWKKVRLPETAALDNEYKGIYKKALKDILLGLLFGIVVHFVLCGITMIALEIEMHKIDKEIAVLQKELTALENGSYQRTDSENLNDYLNLNDWLVKMENPEAVSDHESDWDSSAWGTAYEELEDSAKELNEIADMFAEITENIQQVVEYKEENTDAEHINDGRPIVRERPVLAGESLWSIAEEVYRNPHKWEDIYEANKNVIGEDPSLIYKEQYLVIPEDESRKPTDYEYAYREVVDGTGDWEGIKEYIAPDCGYEIQNCIFYYTLPEGDGEKFRICYPKLISLNGKDVSAVNAAIRERAMINADYMLINRTEDFSKLLTEDERYSTEWVQDQVNYIITYLDENTISVVFQYYVFEGSIYAEYLELRTFVADINTGRRYKTTELLTNLEDGKVAETVNESIISFYEAEEKEFQTWAFTEIMTAELINETLQSDQVVEGRYYSNVFLTPDGVGIGFVYRMNKEVNGYSKILRGWKNVILPREEVKEYLTNAPVWEYTDTAGTE